MEGIEVCLSLTHESSTQKLSQGFQCLFTILQLTRNVGCKKIELKFLALSLLYSLIRLDYFLLLHPGAVQMPHSQCALPFFPNQKQGALLTAPFPSGIVRTDNSSHSVSRPLGVQSVCAVVRCLQCSPSRATPRHDTLYARLRRAALVGGL